jgi:hypothetical protein
MEGSGQIHTPAAARNEAIRDSKAAAFVVRLFKVYQFVFCFNCSLGTSTAPQQFIRLAVARNASSPVPV